MAFGRGYTAGSTPVDIHGKSIVDLSKTGGWIAAFFIFGIYIIMCQFTYSFFKCFETFFQLELQFYLNNQQPFDIYKWLQSDMEITNPLRLAKWWGFEYFAQGIKLVAADTPKKEDKEITWNKKKLQAY